MSFATGDNVPINTAAELAAVNRLSVGWSPSRRCFIVGDEAAPEPGSTLIVICFLPPSGEEYSMSPALAEQVRLALEAPHA